MPSTATRRAVSVLALTTAVAATALAPSVASARAFEGQEPVQVTISANKTHVDLNRSVKLTFKITGYPRSAGPAFGNIHVFDGSTEIAVVAVDHSKAKIKLTGLPAGDHPLSGVYGGDDTHAPNESDVVHVTVD
jgi:hypothetical protein